jgi:hypothetical protein
MAVPAQQQRRRIVVQNGLVLMELVTLEKVGSLGDWMNKVLESSPSPSKLLPLDCVDNFSLRRKDTTHRRIYVTYMHPRMQTFRFRGDRANAQAQQYELSWPHTLWWFVFSNQQLNGLYLTATKVSPYEVPNYMDLDLFWLPCPNQYPEGHFCLGNLSTDISWPDWRRVNVLRNDVLSSNWNTDLIPNLSGFPFSSIPEWAEQSSRKPELWKELPFKPYVHPTYRKMCDYLMGVGGRE